MIGGGGKYIIPADETWPSSERRFRHMHSSDRLGGM